MRFIKDTQGFSFVELMIATLVMTVGLTGVAAMQIKALNGTFFANSQASGATVALAWSEWLSGMIANGYQDTKEYKRTVNGQVETALLRENFVYLTMLDDNQADSFDGDTYAPDAKPTPHFPPFVQVELPTTTQGLADCFNGVTAFVTSSGKSVKLKFKKQQLEDSDAVLFTAADMPPLAPPGARLLLRVAANVPVGNTATIEVAVKYKNAFVNDRGATLRFVVASNP